MTTEHYHQWSPYNFTNAQWKEAAERYVQLLERIRELEGQHNDGDHQDFVRCEVCEEISGLNRFHDQFASHFAPLWAKRLAAAHG